MIGDRNTRYRVTKENPTKVTPNYRTGKVRTSHKTQWLLTIDGEDIRYFDTKAEAETYAREYLAE